VDCGGGQINIAGHTVHDAPGDHFGLVPVWKALAVSSNVCAIRVGQRVGPEVLYKYIRAFGFGDRSGIELPAETRGLVEPLKRWGPASMGAIPMGQEVAVTPIQIATMVSSIANGGTYLPPRLLLASTDDVKGNPKLKPAAFHPGYEIPKPLPDGGHRVISEMTAAQLRKMMEDVVLMGTARGAVHLNGYSAAGKTGTAEKIDPRTRTYSKTKFVASFVGFAPVNNPAITIAVVMDSPEHSMHFGAQASAPVFQELGQEILEYLGVPHDQEVKSVQEMAKVPGATDETAAEADEDVEQLFAQVNNLPADDPLRNPNSEDIHSTDQGANEIAISPPPSAGAPRNQAFVTTPTGPSASPAVIATQLPSQPPNALSASAAADRRTTPAQASGPGSVVVDSTQRVAVPSFVGQGLRQVVEQAGTSGLEVQVLGTGLAREQSPSPGIMVPQGTKVVVRFTR
jgi:cell division protein FtsI (penicillin-binding protein 3)